MSSARNPRSRPSHPFQPSMPGWPSTTNRQPTWPASRASGPPNTVRRVGEWTPSAPTTRSKVADEPSSNTTRTASGPSWTEVTVTPNRIGTPVAPSARIRRSSSRWSAIGSATSRQRPASSKSISRRPRSSNSRLRPTTAPRSRYGFRQPEPSQRRHAVAGQVDARRGDLPGRGALDDLALEPDVAGRHEPWPARRYRHRRSGSASSPDATAGRRGLARLHAGHRTGGRDVMTVIDWLLDSDPSIRWQVMRDLTHEPADVIAAERSRVATEGWGARLLALQAPDGRWGGRPWSLDYTDTFHVLELLRRFGLDPGARRLAGPSVSSASRSPGAIPSSRPRGPTTGSSRARSSRASTATSSRPARTSGWT